MEPAIPAQRGRSPERAEPGQQVSQDPSMQDDRLWVVSVGKVNGSCVCLVIVTHPLQDGKVYSANLFAIFMKSCI
ncbi:hypothetical protein GCM10008938_32250 [Deinococcus roseus]|uniref:Uncharacterized protein n=1 Tax=Deinococcus roseus TaxID=392414 RepID=A0ABQ2D4X8_9DEIO|nr:hypothetical protein GCM10008938_32250 [Deinococcus roseus]